MAKEIEYAERINKVLETLGVKSRTIGHYALAKELVGAAVQEEQTKEALKRQEELFEKARAQQLHEFNMPSHEVKHLDNIAIILDHIFQVLQREVELREQSLEEIKESRKDSKDVLAATCEALRQSS